MKIFLVLLMGAIFSFTLSAQNNWSKTYRIDGVNEYALQNVLLGDTLLVFSFSGSDSKFAIVGVQFNTAGSITKGAVINGTDGVGISHYPGLTVHDNNLILSGETFNFPASSTLYGFQINSHNLNLDMSWSIPSDSNYFSFIKGHQQLTGASLLFYGSRRQTGFPQSHGYLMATDLDGALIWDLSIGDNDNFQYMIMAPLAQFNDSLLLGVATRSVSTFANAEIILFGVRIDGTLEFVKAVGWPHWFTPTHDRFSQVHTLSDTSFLFTSYTNTTGEEPLPPFGYIVAMDTNSKVLWQLFDDPLDKAYHNRIIRIIRLQNGDFVGVGSKVMEVSQGSVSGSQHIGWAFRFSPDGILAWERHYAVPEARTFEAHILHNAYEGNDGSMFLVGGVVDSVEDVSPNWAYRKNWVLKVGPDGCMDPGCTDQVILLPTQETFRILPEDYLRVYPNPVRDMLQVSWEELPAGAAFLTVHDLSGRLLGTWPVNDASGALSLDVGSWPAGIAILTLRSAHWMTLPLKVVVE